MPLKKVRILAVDDNETHSYALSRSLRHLGAEVVSANCGLDTLRLAKLLPDVILLDVNLPDIDGFQVCKQLKNEPITAKIPVIFITATYQNSVAKIQAESVGGACILFHPVETPHLLAVIEGQLHRRSSSS